MIEAPSLEMYPCQREISLIFGDIDSVGHVNNVAIARFFEEGRVLLHRRIGELRCASAASRMVLVHVEIYYLAEVEYPGHVLLGAGLCRVGRTSIEHRAGLFQDGKPVAVSRSVDVNTAAGRVGAEPLGEQYRNAARRMIMPSC
ncbi:acyl-CoA thioesterase [Nocardia sp. NPDC005366]|uniref:acyl-CoA thioesterase n=1 Tax=Nocardia sp. NPDC005366 TaxID=3156878 RepID=UPI0033A6CA78